jgi:hypothetical protein
MHLMLVLSMLDPGRARLVVPGGGQNGGKGEWEVETRLRQMVLGVVGACVVGLLVQHWAYKCIPVALHSYCRSGTTYLLGDMKCINCLVLTLYSLCKSDWQCFFSILYFNVINRVSGIPISEQAGWLNKYLEYSMLIQLEPGPGWIQVESI